MLKVEEYKKYLKEKTDTVVLCVAQRKGGVGKTIVCSSLARTFAKAHYSCLVIDGDPQHSMTNVLGVNSILTKDPLMNPTNIPSIAADYRKIMNENPVYEIDDLSGLANDDELEEAKHNGLHNLIESVVEGYPISEKDVRKAIITPYYEIGVLDSAKGDDVTFDEEFNKKKKRVQYGFDLLPSSEDVLDDELGLSKKQLTGDSSISIFKAIIKEIKKLNKYDIILIDCAPSMSLFTINSMYASDGSIIVGMPDKQSLFSLAKTKKNFRELQVLDINQRGILGFVLNNCRGNDPKKTIMEYTIKYRLGLRFYDTVIPQSSKASYGNTANRMFVDMDKGIKKIFESLAAEVLQSYLDNEEWTEYRIAEFEKYKKEISQDKKVLKKLIKEISGDFESDIEKKYSMTVDEIKARTGEEKFNTAKENYIKNNLNRYLNYYVREQQEKNKLWETRTSEFKAEIGEAND